MRGLYEYLEKQHKANYTMKEIQKEVKSSSNGVFLFDNDEEPVKKAVKKPVETPIYKEVDKDGHLHHVYEYSESLLEKLKSMEIVEEEEVEVVVEKSVEELLQIENARLKIEIETLKNKVIQKTRTCIYLRVENTQLRVENTQLKQLNKKEVEEQV
jgi:hypothetical protein